MGNAVHGKTMKNLRNRIAVKPVSNNIKKNLLKMDIKKMLSVTKNI